MSSEPVLVFVPCFTGAPWSAVQLAPYGARPRRTPRLPDDIDDMEAYADALAQVVGDLDSYVLIGDSFGANVSIALATRRPKGLRALVVSGGFAANPIKSRAQQAMLRSIAKMRGFLYRNVTLRLYVRNLVSPYDAEGQLRWSAADSWRLFVENTPATTFEARLKAGLKSDYTDRLKNINVPTLILSPSFEGIISDDASRIMRENIPDAREVVLDRTGHMFRFSHPETYANAVKAFLDLSVSKTGA